MARTSNLWKTGTGGTYIQTIGPLGYDILINGTDKYLNFNAVVGSSGYGFRDNAGTIQWKNSGGSWQDIGTGGGGSGDVVGPASATDNAIARFDTTTGKLIQNSVVTIDDTTGKIKINGTQTVYLPDQTSFTGSLVVGDGGNNLTHTTSTTGFYNTFIGIGAGSSAVSTSGNVAIGYQAANANTSGSGVFIGYQAGLISQSSDTLIGYQSGLARTNNGGSTFVGHQSGINSISGQFNTIFGYQTGWGITTGGSNTIIGSRVQGLATNLSNNIILSDGAGSIRAQWASTGALKLTPYGAGTFTGTATYNLAVTAAGNVIEVATGGGGTPGGANTELQWNNAGAFAGIAGATSNGSNLIMANGSFQMMNAAGTFSSTFQNTNASAQSYDLPDLSGTVALLNSTGLGVVTVDNLALALNTVTGISGLNFINSANDLYKFRSFTNSGIDAIFDVSLVATSDKTYTLQNASGTLAFLSDITAPTLTSTYIGVGDGSNLLSGSSAFTYASGRITNTATTEQLRLAYDASNYLSNTISSNGTTSYAITSSSGTPTFNFNKEMIVDLGTIPYIGQYVHRITAVDTIFGGTYDLITNFGYNYTTQYWSAQSRNPGIIEFDGGTQSFSFRSGNGGFTDIFGYNKLDLRTLAGQNVRIMNGSTVNIQVTTGGNVELQDSVKLLTYGSGTHSGTAVYTLQVDASGNVIEGVPSRLKGYTVAGLPSGVQGDTAFVTNALGPVYGNTVVGGGAVVTPVFYDGTNWIVG